MNKRQKKKRIRQANTYQQGGIYTNGTDVRWVMASEDGFVHYIVNPEIGEYPHERLPFEKCSVSAFRKWMKKNIGHSGSNRPGFLDWG